MKRAGGEVREVGSRARAGRGINVGERLEEVIGSGGYAQIGAFLVFKHDEIWSVDFPTNQRASIGLAFTSLFLERRLKKSPALN